MSLCWCQDAAGQDGCSGAGPAPGYVQKSRSKQGQEGMVEIHKDQGVAGRCAACQRFSLETGLIHVRNAG